MKLTARILFFVFIFFLSSHSSYMFGQFEDNNKGGENGDSDLNVGTLSIVLKQKVQILDVFGNVIIETDSNDESILETLPSGTYLINLLDDVGNVLFTSEYIK